MSSPLQHPAWTIRPYLPGDERALVALFQRVFGRPMTETQWLWKLKHLPSPVENVWLAVDEHGKPIFQYAGIPVRYHLPIGEKTVMIGVDNMTAPEFRRQGLFTTGGRFIYDTWRNAGIPFVLGLPNEQSGARSGALGLEEIFLLQWLVRPLHPAALLARRFRVSAFARLTLLGTLWNRVWDYHVQPDDTIHLQRVDQAGLAFDILWHTCLADIPISVVRGSAWVNWRYLTAPSFGYRVVLAERSGQPLGYIVYRLAEHTGRRVGFIAELLTKRADTKVRNTLIAYTIHHLRAEGAETVITLAVPHTWLHTAFRRAGFLFSWGSFSVQLAPLDPTLPMATVRNPHNWYMVGGDFDII